MFLLFEIKIISALYGRTSKTPCGDVNSNCKKTLDVTEFAKKECNNRHHCQLQPTNSWGDPCPNVYKYLDVYFECVESTCFTPLLDSSGKKGPGSPDIDYFHFIISENSPLSHDR